MPKLYSSSQITKVLLARGFVLKEIPEGTFKTNSRQQKYLDYFLVDKI